METQYPERIIKRDGSVVPFDKTKIENAIYKAAMETLQDERESREVSRRATSRLLDLLRERPIPGTGLTVEYIQDMVEEALMETGHHLTAKNYILYRKRHEEIRETKSICGIGRDDLKLSINAVQVLKKRYLRRDDSRKIIETPSQMFRRVAKAVSQAEEAFAHSQDSGEEAEDAFYRMMSGLEFLPNSPTLMNADTPLGQLSACFVIPIEDSIESIFAALKDMAIIHQSGGGTGFNFSNLRPNGDLVESTRGEASGPVSFMRIFDKATQVIVQGGKRRGANMGILRCDHPDILEFIEAKMDGKSFSNFNLSVGITDAFMEAVKVGGRFDLINPHTGRHDRSVNARTIFDLITTAAWRIGDPGLVFLDQINRNNPTPGLGMIDATNPCGEIPLLPFESCNLGSINLSKVVKGKEIDWERLKGLIQWGVRFLDDVIEINRYPLPKIKEITMANRKIGLGLMGFADMLVQMGVSYSSKRAITIAENLMRFVHHESFKASSKLALARGTFPNIKKAAPVIAGMQPRNTTVNTIAPTGSISIIAGCSSGIEPLFALSFARQVLSGARLFETNPLFEAALRERGIYDNALMVEVAKRGSIQDMDSIPSDIRQIFVTTFDITPDQHLKVQAAFQRYTDNSVSKTVNLPSSATIEDVKRIYMAAYRMGCKGITVYRYGSKRGQALSLGGDLKADPHDHDPVWPDLNGTGCQTCIF